MKVRIAWGLALLLTACSESFPGLYAPTTPDNEYNSGEVTEDWSFVPILPSLSDVNYEVLTSRGTGVFEDWDTDKEHWKKADFHTFAFLTRNVFGGEANYTQHGNPSYCLLDDVVMNIENDNFDLGYKDKVMRRYPQDRQNYKYRFYMYYADDAADPAALRYETRRVTVPVELDGTQDVMHSFAYHTAEEFDAVLRRLPSGNDESRIISQYGQELFYSTISGHRGINPIFHMKHLLSRIDVMIKGEKSSDGSDSYRKIIVKSIRIATPTQGTLVVADDNWTEESYLQAVKNRQVLQMPVSDADMDTVDCHLVDKPHDYPLVEQFGGFHVSSTTPEKVAEPLLLPPLDSYTLVIRFLFLDINSSTGLLQSQPKEFVATYDNIRLAGSAGANGFEPGKSYTFRIYVYGMQDIQLKVVDLPVWEEGGSIEIGSDEDNNEN